MSLDKRLSRDKRLYAQKERLEKYGVIRANRLTTPTGYYFDGRFGSGNEGRFPRNFLYKGKLVWDTFEYILADCVMEALCYTFGEVITDYVAYKDKHSPRFAAEIHFVGGDGVLYVWGWDSVHRLYTVMDRPYQFYTGVGEKDTVYLS